MPPTLYAHPFSSYCQKVLIALYESATPFTYRVLGEDPDAGADWESLWPLKRMPVLVDGGRTVLESSTIIEYLGHAFPGPVRHIPENPQAALDVRMWDRIFDNYIMTPMQKIVLDHLRPDGTRDPHGVQQAHDALETAYRWIDGELAGKAKLSGNASLAGDEWVAGEGFSLADCAAAPSLFYADWVHEIGQDFANLRAYRSRLLARPSVARCVDEARPFRKYFPPGAPDRD